MNGPPLEDDVAHMQGQLDIGRALIARQAGELATMRSDMAVMQKENEQLHFDVKFLKAEIVKLQHALKSCQLELNGSKDASS